MACGFTTNVAQAWMITMAKKLSPEKRQRRTELLGMHINAVHRHAVIAHAIAKELGVATDVMYLYHSSAWYPRRLTLYTQQLLHNLERLKNDEFEKHKQIRAQRRKQREYVKSNKANR